MLFQKFELWFNSSDASESRSIQGEAANEGTVETSEVLAVQGVAQGDNNDAANGSLNYNCF